MEAERVFQKTLSKALMKFKASVGFFSCEIKQVVVTYIHKKGGSHRDST